MSEFSPGRADSLAPLVRSLVDELLTGCITRGTFDVLSEIGVPLPVMTSCAMLGLPRDEWDQLLAWAQLITGQIGRFGYDAEQLSAIDREVATIVEYIERLCADRRRHPGDDVLSRLVANTADGEGLDRDDMTALVLLLLINGLETMTTAVGNAVWTVLERPGLLAHLRTHAADATAVFNEALRWMSPVRIGSRRLTADLEYGEHLLRRRDTVLFLWAAANRDPRRFPDPDVFDPHRPPRSHLAFGKGAHHCLGAPLAAVQGTLLLQRLAQRCPDLAVAAPADVQWRTSLALQGPAILPVRTSAPAAALPVRGAA
jgi:cytochrome P450